MQEKMDKDLLYRFFEGQTTIEEETRILDWVDESPENQKEFLDYRKLYDMMLLNEDKIFRKPVGRGNLRKWGGVLLRYAAVIVVTLAAGGGYFYQRYNALAENFNTISVPAGQHVDLTLPDGTKVALNACSELKYPSCFVGDNRCVELSGEAFFEVARNEEQPFVVETYACDVEVLGTKFDVEAREQNNHFMTTLVNGSVRVSKRGNPNRKVVLEPNQQVSLCGEELVVAQKPQHEEFLWRQGLIAFRDASFEELLKEFEYCFNVKFEINREKLPQTLFTGKLRVSDGVDHAMWVLQQNADFKFRHTSGAKECILIE